MVKYQDVYHPNISYSKSQRLLRLTANSDIYSYTREVEFLPISLRNPIQIMNNKTVVSNLLNRVPYLASFNGLKGKPSTSNVIPTS